MNLNNMGLKNKITMGSCAPIILVAIMGFVAYQSIGSLLQTAGWVKHTHEVVEHAMTIEKLIVDMETGERGFLIAGKDEFLEPYNNGKAAMIKVIQETKELVSDNPKQVGRLEVIESSIAGWHQNAAGPEIAERRKVVLEAEAAATFEKLQGRTVGKEIFDNLRGALAIIDAKFKAAGNLAGRYLLLNTTMDLVNMETGQRGFLLSGEEASLDPFRNGQKSLTNHLEELKKMSQGKKSSGVTVGDINKVQTLADRWVEKAANPEIDARREMNKVTTVMADVTALIEAGTGKQFMDALRVNLETFKGEELANQTAKATEDISKKVQSIQADSSNAVHAIAEISEIINKINDISSTIASSVEEQSATTNEMSRNVQEAAQGIGEITQNISGVSVKAKQTTEGTRDTSEAAGELAKLSLSLGTLVAKFKI